MGTENRWEYRFGTLSPGAVNVGSLGQKVVGRNTPPSLMRPARGFNALRVRSLLIFSNAMLQPPALHSV